MLVTTQLVHMECWSCGVLFAVTQDFDRLRRERGDRFHCPRGCNIYYGDSELSNAKRELERERRRSANLVERTSELYQELDTTQKRLSATKGVVTRTKKRIAKGVCPCCNRHFDQLHRHMKEKHPDYAGEKGEKEGGVE